jgi:porin
MYAFFLKSAKIIFLIGLLFSIHSLAFSHDESDSINTVTWELTYTGDAARNFTGGIKKGNVYMGLIKAGIDVNTRKLWNGGNFYFEVMNTHGGKLSGNYTGDLQVISNIENGNYTFLEKLYFNQKLSRLSVIIGLQDLNEEFCTCDYSSALTNSSFGIHSAFPLNFSVPIYPKTALGINATFNYTENISFKGCVFDGNVGTLEEDPHNLKWSLSSADGYLYLAEFDYITSEENTSIKAGVVYHSGKFHYPDNQLKSKKGNSGFYLTTDQLLFSDNDRKLGIFGQLAYFPQRINFNPLYIGSGLNFSGFISKRKDDVLAAGLAYSRLYDKSNEYDVELNYSYAVNRHIILQPAFHYIINPGANAGLKDAFAAFLRFSIIK